VGGCRQIRTRFPHGDGVPPSPTQTKSKRERHNRKNRKHLWYTTFSLLKFWCRSISYKRGDIFYTISDFRGFALDHVYSRGVPISGRWVLHEGKSTSQENLTGQGISGGGDGIIEYGGCFLWEPHKTIITTGKRWGFGTHEETGLKEKTAIFKNWGGGGRKTKHSRREGCTYKNLKGMMERPVSEYIISKKKKKAKSVGFEHGAKKAQPGERVFSVQKISELKKNKKGKTPLSHKTSRPPSKKKKTAQDTSGTGGAWGRPPPD